MMSRLRQLNQIIRSSNRLIKSLANNPSVRSCVECTQRLILTNVIVLRETERILLRRLFARFSTKGNVKTVHRLLLGACFFSWAEDKITEEEMQHSMNTLLGKHSLTLNFEDKRESFQPKCLTGMRPNNGKVELIDQFKGLKADPNCDGEWEEIVKRDGFRLWRRKIDDTEVYEYKVHGVITDIPARAFLSVQLDLQYRRTWDSKIIELEVVDQDEETDTEVVHWVMRYPYPMANREYVYLRRHCLDQKRNAAVIVSRVVPEHPAVPSPEDSNLVRVTRYESVMLIKANSHFDTNGFEYYLKYCDDPKASFPGFAYKWMATHGLPAFLDDVHRAAVILHREQTNEVFS